VVHPRGPVGDTRFTIPKANLASSGVTVCRRPFLPRLTGGIGGTHLGVRGLSPLCVYPRPANAEGDDGESGKLVPMMRYGYGYGNSHWGLWVLMIVAMIVFWGAIAWIIVTLVRRQGVPPGSPNPPPGPAANPPSSDGLRILNERFARGEIDEDEYKHRRSVIEGTG
jgi:putative membrane protein